jgi:hypothetical protein
VFYTMAILGPALGYSIGGQFLNIHADFLRFFLQLFLSSFLLTYLTSRLLPRVRARVQRAPVLLGSLTCKTGRPPPWPSYRSLADPSGKINEPREKSQFGKKFRENEV